MVFGLCRGAWPYKGLCTAGGKLAAEALRVLKKSIQHAGARKTRLGRRPLIPVAPGSALAWWEKGVEHKTKTGAGPSASGCLAPPHPQRILILKISVFFLFSHTLTADSAPLALSFWGWCKFHCRLVVITVIRLYLIIEIRRNEGARGSPIRGGEAGDPGY